MLPPKVLRKGSKKSRKILRKVEKLFFFIN